MLDTTDRLTFNERWVHDTREVLVEVSGAPDLYTRTGLCPIEPAHVRIYFNMNGDLRDVIVAGMSYGKRSRGIRRRVDVTWAPLWLADLIERYRP